jgi:hypothetical protein
MNPTRNVGHAELLTFVELNLEKENPIVLPDRLDRESVMVQELAIG